MYFDEALPSGGFFIWSIRNAADKSFQAGGREGDGESKQEEKR